MKIKGLGPVRQDCVSIPAAGIEEHERETAYIEMQGVEQRSGCATALEQRRSLMKTAVGTA